ncbi:MAG: hypothetical protein KDE31_04950 [Caldilineaceae bacterium]|nr:hypothetical protein [Caldilineaceae bacterium]
MTPAQHRVMLDDAIEIFARNHACLSFSEAQSNAHTLIDSAAEYIRALTGTLPPPSLAALARATNATSQASTFATVIHEVQRAVNLAEQLLHQPASIRDSTAPKKLADTAHALLSKLRKNNSPPQ